MIKAMETMSSWIVLTHKGMPVNRDLLSLRHSLLNGQAFTWFTNGSNYWGTCHGAFYEIKYDEKDQVCWRGVNGSAEKLEDYFGFNVDYSTVFAKLLEKDKVFKSRFESAKGLRVLRQDPWECCISFICSQNNNIKRIGQMVQNLCSNFGEEIHSDDSGKFYGFPSPAKLATVTEKQLTDLGFGYRAKYIIDSSKSILEKGGNDFLLKLRGSDQKSPPTAQLTQFRGIGPKVADCVSLFSLDCYWLVPVDTHMFQLCEKVYKQKFTNYDKAREFLQDKLGVTYAGIAHTFMFTFEINEFAKDKLEPIKRPGNQVKGGDIVKPSVRVKRK